MQYDSIDAAVLSGGKNSRMNGANKAFIELDGKRILDNALEILGTLFSNTIIVTNTPEHYSKYQKSSLIISDIIKDVGPIGGIHAALSSTDKQGVFFMACDMPNLHNALVRKLADKFIEGGHDAVIARSVKGVEPLFGVYAKSITSRIEEYVKEGCGYSLKRFLERINTFYLDVDNADVFCNVNTPEDIKRYEDKDKGMV